MEGVRSRSPNQPVGRPPSKRRLALEGLARHRPSALTTATMVAVSSPGVHDERGGGAAHCERLLQAGSVAVGTGQAVVDRGCARRAHRATAGRRAARSGPVLLVGADAGVADVQTRHRGTMPHGRRRPRQITAPIVRAAGCPVAPGPQDPAAESSRCAAGGSPCGVRLAPRPRPPLIPVTRTPHGDGPPARVQPRLGRSRTPAWRRPARSITKPSATIAAITGHW